MKQKVLEFINIVGVGDQPGKLELSAIAEKEYEEYDYSAFEANSNAYDPEYLSYDDLHAGGDLCALGKGKGKGKGCFKCGEQGHIALNCPHKGAWKGGGKGFGKSSLTNFYAQKGFPFKGKGKGKSSEVPPHITCF